MRFWCDTNSHFCRETHTQYPLKLNAWTGILRDHVVGRTFLKEILTGERYRELLDIGPFITGKLENDVNLNINMLTFRQVGAPSFVTV